MIDLEIQKKYFENHVATFTDYGNIKILDFKNPNSNEYDFCLSRIIAGCIFPVI